MRLDAVCDVLARLGAPYALIGAHAMAARGFVRFTVDVDFLTTDARVMDPEPWARLAASGASIDIRRGDLDDPVAGVVRIRLADRTDVDVVLAKWKWEAELLARAEPVHINSVSIPVPLLGDLILLKLAAGGSLDLHDAAALLRLGDETTIRHVETYLPDIRPDVRDAWEQIRNDR